MQSAAFAALIAKVKAEISNLDHCLNCHGQAYLFSNAGNVLDIKILIGSVVTLTVSACTRSGADLGNQRSGVYALTNKQHKSIIALCEGRLSEIRGAK